MQLHTIRYTRPPVIPIPPASGKACPFCGSSEVKPGKPCPTCNTILPSKKSDLSPLPWHGRPRRKPVKPSPIYQPNHNGIADPVPDEQHELDEYAADLDRLAVDPGDDHSPGDDCLPLQKDCEGLPWD